MAKQKSVVLKLNGKPLEIVVLPVSLVKLKAFLDGAPQDELFTYEEVSKRVGVAPQTIKNLCNRFSEMVSYRSGRKGVQIYFGNPAAIREYERQKEAAEAGAL